MSMSLEEEDKGKAVAFVEALFKKNTVSAKKSVESESLRKELLLVALKTPISTPDSLVTLHALICLADAELHLQDLPRFRYDWTMSGFGPYSRGLTSTLKSLLHEDKQIAYDTKGIYMLGQINDITSSSSQVIDKTVKKVSIRGRIDESVLIRILIPLIQWDGGQVRFK